MFKRDWFNPERYPELTVAAKKPTDGFASPDSVVSTEANGESSVLGGGTGPG